MRNIYFYQCRRLLGNKIFWGLFLVTAWYSRQTLLGETIRGVCSTAPFSPWSFGSYLALLCPFLVAAELFLLSFLTSREEQRVAVLTDASPISPRRYAIPRWGAVLTGTTLLSLLVLGMAGVFYIRFFHWANFGELLAPAAFALLPPLIFFLGAGWFLGCRFPALLYPLAALPFLLAYLPIPPGLDPIGGGFFLTYPLQLGMLDPAFSVPPTVLWVRVGYAALGFLLLALARKKRI